MALNRCGAVGDGCCLHSFSLYPPRCPPRLVEGSPPPPNISENSTRVPVVVRNKARPEIWKLCFYWLLVEDSHPSPQPLPVSPGASANTSMGFLELGACSLHGCTGVHIPASWPHGCPVLFKWDRPRQFQREEWRTGEFVLPDLKHVSLGNRQGVAAFLRVKCKRDYKRC